MNERDVDFAALIAFVTVSRSGSVTAAATELGLSQPGVSRQLQRLEHAVGVPLLRREGRQLRLTSAGERFRDYAETAVTRYEAILREVRGEAAHVEGPLRIGASSTPGEFLVPQWVAAFVALHPRVRPEIAIADTGMVEDAVRAHRYDLGFVGACLRGQGLEYTSVAEDEVVLAVPADHPLANQGEVELEDLAGQPFLVREGGSGTAASVELLLAERGLRLPLRLPPHRTVMVLGSTQAIVSGVERGLGLGWVTARALEDRSPRRVRAVRLRDLPLRRTLSLVRDPQRLLAPAASAFIAWVSQHNHEPAPLATDSPDVPLSRVEGHRTVAG